MDEQNDQAVLELEEIETGADYDYLSILREMQQSLSGDDESADILKMMDDEADLPTESPLTDVAPKLSDGASAAGSGFARIQGENDSPPATDYFADAPTQPLPELPAEFNNHNLASADSLVNGSEAENHAEADASPDHNPALSNGNSSLAVDSSKTVAQSSVRERADVKELNDLSFDDFAELSPILFDADEAAGITEPGFDSELLVESPMEMALLGTTDDLPAESSQTTQTTASETSSDDLPSAADEMPTNLAFSDMLETDSEESNTAFAPHFDFEEDEFKTAPLPHLESNGFASTKSLSELAAPDFEQHLAEQNLPEQNAGSELSAKSDDVPTDEDLELPDSMFFAESGSSFTFAPSTMPADAESQEKGDSAAEMMEPDLSESQTEESETNTSDLSVPWFLQEELTTKHQISEESFPGIFFAEDNFAGEAVQPELDAQPDKMPAAPSVAENKNGAQFETDAASQKETVGKNGFNKNIFPQEANAVFEASASESSNFNFSETQYPEDLPEKFPAAPLENEFGVLPDNLSDEIPEALLLKNSETQTPEDDAVGFDAPPEPEFENVDLAVSEPQPNLDVTSESSEQEPENQNALQENYYQVGKASFLEERFVIFKLDDTLYALPAVNIAEIGQLLPITPLPFVPSWFLGITHLRGDIISVVGLRELWQKNTAVPHKAKILIVHSEKQSLTIALVVDAVREMRHVAPEEIISGESQNDSHFTPYQIGTVDYDGQHLCLLNAEKLLETLRK